MLGRGITEDNFSLLMNGQSVLVLPRAGGYNVKPDIGAFIKERTN
jgi:hypothetical protein